VSDTARGSCFVFSILLFGLLLPTLVSLGGSTNLINWGPGLLFAGAACLLLLDKDRHGVRGGWLHSCGFILLLGFLFVRSRFSPDVSAAANHSALLALAAAGYLIGKLAGETKSRSLFIGLALVTVLNFSCSLMQMADPDWNLIYPRRSGGFPSGLFAHYSYSAAFCLGAAGLLMSRAFSESAKLKPLMIAGVICALATIPLSISRGGNLALAFMVATACALLLARGFSSSKSLMNTWLPVVVLPGLILIFGSLLVPMIGRNKGPGGFYADSVRLDFWKAATEISANHPWLGRGAGGFAREIFHVMAGLTAEPGMVHNEALQVAVEHGWPALVILTALLGVPVCLCFWRFVNKTGATNASWAGMGLLAMIVQSNFESIFHSAPGVFVAALILGQLSRSLWNAGSHEVPAEITPQSDGRLPDRDFLHAVRTCVGDYSAARAEAVPELVALLSRSKDEQWRRGAYRLSYWSKIQDEAGLRNAMNGLGERCSAALAALPSTKEPVAINLHSRGWRVAGNLALAACAIPILLSGAGLCRAFIHAWVPVYHPHQLSVHERFTALLRVVENRSGMGIDRKVLAAGLDCIDDLQSMEAREYWAAAYRPRLLRAVSGWRTDPGAALQLAEIVGWAGDVEAALDLYNHAIAAQGMNERLFMAHAFKGRYLYELYLSASADGKSSRRKFYALQAVTSFQNAIAAMGDKPGFLDANFARMMRECEAAEKNVM
jgi:O-antigen ligase